MICYVLAMGKQHLGPHVVVGYGIKMFVPRPLHYVTRSPGEESLVLTSGQYSPCMPLALGYLFTEILDEQYTGGEKICRESARSK